MKKRIFSVLLTLCMVATLLPTVALAAAAPTEHTYYGKNICANGTPLKIVAGTTANYTNILYDMDNNGAIGDTEYLKIGSAEPTAAGYDLSDYRICGGAYSGNLGSDSMITIDGGYVGDVMGGNVNDNLTGNVTIVMNGGSVARILACGYWANVGGDGKTASITITGGTVRGGADHTVNLEARITAGTDKELTITGGTINGTIDGATPSDGGGSSANVYKTALTLKDGSTAKANAAVSALTLSSGSYGMNDVKTDASGKLNVYLSAGIIVTGATADGDDYTNDPGITVLDTNAAQGDLTKALPAALTGTVNITGTMKYGSELTATVTGSNNTGTLSYQWQRGGSNIDSATNDRYTLVAEDIAKTITCIVSGSVQTGTLSATTGTIGKADGPAVTGVTKTDCTTSDNDDGILTNVSTTMEYKVSTASGWIDGPGSPISGLADGAYHVRVKETPTHNAGAQSTFVIAAYSAPSTGSSYTPPTTYTQPATYTVPVKSGAGSVKASATVSNGTATVSVNNSQLDTLLNSTDTSGSVSIDAGLDRNIDTATIPVSAIDKIADASNDSSKAVVGLEVALDTGKVALDAKALAAASKKADGSTISIHVEEIARTGLTDTQLAALTDEHYDDLVVEVTIISGGAAITSYDGGRITVTLPYMLKAGETVSGVRVWHLASNGTLTLMQCRYNEATKTVSFVTDHLSDFIVGCDASVTNPNTGIDSQYAGGDRVAWFFEYMMNICRRSMNGIINKNGDAALMPPGSIQRSQIAALLRRAIDNTAR